jgi:hypothetical protein
MSNDVYDTLDRLHQLVAELFGQGRYDEARFGPGKVLDPGSHMERSQGREFQAMSGAPVKKLPASPCVSSPSVPMAIAEVKKSM